MRVLELVCLVVFIAAAGGIVWFFRHRATTLSDYYVGGRNIGGWVTAFTWSAAAASAGLFLGGAGMTYTFGWPGMMYQFGSLGGVFIAWLLLAPRLRRMSARLGAMTTPPLPTSTCSPVPSRLWACWSYCRLRCTR